MNDPELLSLRPKTSYSRRDFLVRSLGAGFALAVLPVSGETITTDATGLTAGEVRIPVKDGQIPAYRAMPRIGKAVPGSFPLVLVVQEIFGVHEHIKDICRRLAKAGYLAIAPALYARQGDVAAMSDIQEILKKVVSKVPDAQVLSDLDACVAWAKNEGGDVGRLGITGFCWGGRIVWLYAAHSTLLKAGVAWYGRLVGDKTDLQPKHPIDIASELKAPVLGLYGGKDEGITADSIEKMRAALKAAKVKTEIVVFPQAPHGFNADYRPSYRPEEAREGWRRLLEWFKRNGVG